MEVFGGGSMVEMVERMVVDFVGSALVCAPAAAISVRDWGVRALHRRPMNTKEEQAATMASQPAIPIAQAATVARSRAPHQWCP